MPESTILCFLEPVLVNLLSCYDQPNECDATRGLQCLGVVGKKKCAYVFN
jgi:hypothetical protein